MNKNELTFQFIEKLFVRFQFFISRYFLLQIFAYKYICVQKREKKCQKKPRKGIVGGIHVFNVAIRFSILAIRSFILLWACCNSSNVNGDDDGYEDFLIVSGVPNI